MFSFSYCIFRTNESIVEIFWRGSLDEHVTLESESDSGYTRWGSSCQIGQALVDRVASIMRRNPEVRNQRVADYDDRLKVCHDQYSL